jgi:hypothetical protein
VPTIYRLTKNSVIRWSISIQPTAYNAVIQIYITGREKNDRGEYFGNSEIDNYRRACQPTNLRFTSRWYRSTEPGFKKIK